jgi:hypothetical protein
MSQDHMQDIDALIVCGILADQIVIRQVALEHLRRWGFFDLDVSIEDMTDEKRAMTFQILKVLNDLDKSIKGSADRAMMTPLARKKLELLSAAGALGSGDLATQAAIVSRSERALASGKRPDNGSRD